MNPNPFEFKHPFTSMVAGPTSSGKTVIVSKIIKNIDSLVDKKIERIVYCYSLWQNEYDEILKNNMKVEFHQGIIESKELDPTCNNLVILDDLMDICEKDEETRNLFIKGSHHLNTSLIYIVQNVFSNGKYSRTISLNTKYFILTKNKRDARQIMTLASQMYPTNSKFLIEAYYDAISQSQYGYLVIDLTEDIYSVQTQIFPKEDRIIYIEKK